MESHDLLRCANCGAEWLPVTAGSPDETATCPVCAFPYARHAVAPHTITSVDELEAHLSALLTNAWDAGLEADAIVAVLRNELEFVAELAYVGRRFCVQLLDLGPQERGAIYQSASGRGLPLRSRGVGERA